MSQIAAGMKLKSTKDKPKPSGGGGRGDLLDAIRNGPKLKKTKPAGDSGDVGGSGGGGGSSKNAGENEYGDVVDGKWKDKSPPAHLDMMAEMGWKRKQKEAKAAWEEEQAKANADSADEDDEMNRRKNLNSRLTS